MTVVAFAFTKVAAEKKAQARGAVNINTDIAVVSADEVDLVTGKTSQKGVKVNFEYKNSFTPNLGHLSIGGEIIYLAEPKRHEAVMKGYRKDKTFPEEVTARLYDTISVRATVLAVQISSAVGLPPPIPLPRFTAKKMEKTKK